MEAKRIKNMGVSIFARMTKLAFENKAVNLGQGFPDFDGPDFIKDFAYEAMKAGKNQYAPLNGVFSLRLALSKIHKEKYGLEWNPDNEIAISAGATEALYAAITAFIDDGDEAIIFEPFYDAYPADVEMAGGTPKFITLKKPDFSFDFKELEKAITPKTKMIILNNPHNPTGKVFTFEELEFISKIAKERDLIVVSDEVYEYLLFDGHKHTPIASLPDMRNRAITISSSGKTFGMTGWKVGFAFADAKFIEAILKVRQWTTFAVNTPAQIAMGKAFERLDSYLPDFLKLYQQKRDLIYKLLNETPFKPIKPKGSYFVMASFPKEFAADDFDAAYKLVERFKVAVIPPSVFYRKSNEGKTMLRICFAKKDETLIEGVRRMKRAAL